jgi:hypothetical protein
LEKKLIYKILFWIIETKRINKSQTRPKNCRQQMAETSAGEDGTRKSRRRRDDEVNPKRNGRERSGRKTVD